MITYPATRQGISPAVARTHRTGGRLTPISAGTEAGALCKIAGAARPSTDKGAAHARCLKKLRADTVRAEGRGSAHHPESARKAQRLDAPHGGRVPGRPGAGRPMPRRGG